MNERRISVTIFSYFLPLSESIGYIFLWSVVSVGDYVVIEKIENFDASRYRINSGEKVDGKVVDIQKGILKDFIREEKLQKPENAIKETLKLTFSTPTNETAWSVMQVSGHKNSTMQKFLLQYGELKVGTPVKLVRNDNGYLRLSFNTF